jgi:4-amino-4-deoxy-L-arabinose transferase-like glycosyltransferase
MASITRSPPRSAVARTTTLLRVHGPLLVLAAALAFLAWCTLSTLSQPGLQYDEALFVNAALGGHYAGGAFVIDRFHDVPTMVMPYSGALKSWLYAPIFDLFGGSVAAIRLPMLAVLAATICLAFAFARRLLGAWPAALLALLMATDPVFMTMAKADWGPVALAALLRVGALAAWFAWLRTASARYLWLLAAALALGIFNKVDYLSFAVALAAAAVVVHHRRIVQLVRLRPLAVAGPALALGAVLLVEYREIYLPAREIASARFGAGFMDRLTSTWDLASVTMDGTAVYQYMTTLPLGRQTAIATATTVALVLAAALLLWAVGRALLRRAALPAPFAESVRTCTFLLVLLVVNYLVLVATPEAVGPHHAMLLWPLPALLMAGLVGVATRVPRADLRVASTALLVLGVLVLAGTQVRVADAYRASFEEERAWTPVWSTEIYPLARAVQRRAPGVDAIVTTDWGFGNQLLALGDDDVRRRLVDGWGSFSGAPEAADALVESTLRGRRTVVLLHVRGAEAVPGTQAAAESALERLRPARGMRELYRGSALLAYLVDDRPREKGG